MKVNMRFLKKVGIAILIVAVVSVSYLFFYAKTNRVTPILMYHAINDDEASSLNVSPENFSRQMEFLRREGYSVISLDELISNIAKGIQFIPKTVVLTFDDGFRDNYFYAFPVLVKYKMPAEIFLITNHIGEREGYLNWDEVCLMSGNGINFGGHTRNDVYLPLEKNKERLWDEIAGSKADIEKKTGKDAEYFCFPTGGFNEEIKNIVKKAGYRGACTTNRGFDRRNRDVYELNRVKITNSDMTKPFHFRAKLSGCYNLLRRLRSGS